MTKKLEKLLLKYKKANRARINAYCRRSRMLSGVWDHKQNKRVYKSVITDALKKELDVNIEIARIYKLKVSKELQAYCKKKKLHIEWGDSNQVKGIYSHTSWLLRKFPQSRHANTLLFVIWKLKLSTSESFVSEISRS